MHAPPRNRHARPTPLPATLLGGALFAAALGTAALVMPGSARACSCAPGTPEAHFAAATAVFEGRVLSVARTGDPDVGPGRLVVTFEVVQTWKAANAERVVVSTASDSAACGVSFEQGRSYLVYTSTGDDDGLVAGLCGGTTLREEAEAAVATMGAGVTPVDVTDEAPASPRRTTAPGAGGCASCNVGAQRRDVGAAQREPAAPLALCGAALLFALVVARRRR